MKKEEGGRRDFQVETESLLMNKMNVAHGDNLHAGKSEASALQSVKEVGGRPAWASLQLYLFLS